jgi:hypothetical protein
MTQLIRPVLAGLGNSRFAVDLQLSDMKNEDAVKRARGDAGSSIAWILGHLLSYRCGILKACGIDQPNPYEKFYAAANPASDGSDYPDIAELRKEWNEIHAKLTDALSQLDEDKLLGDYDMPIGDGSFLGALSFFTWHEAYHIGVIGMLRVAMGYRHTHELAMEAMQKESGSKS